MRLPSVQIPPGLLALLMLASLLSLASCHNNDALRSTASRQHYPKTVPQDDLPLFPGLKKKGKRKRVATREGERRPFTRESGVASRTTSRRGKSSRKKSSRSGSREGAVAKTRTPAPAAAREDFANEEEWLRHGVETTAEAYIGTPYHYGGTTTEGFDCSGFTRHVLRDFGIGLNRVSMSQAKQGRAVDPKQAKPGDLIYFANGDGRVNHVGIVVANGRAGLEMVHASSSQGIVRDNVTTSEYWSGRLAGARCVVECRLDEGLQARSGR